MKTSICIEWEVARRQKGDSGVRLVSIRTSVWQFRYRNAMRYEIRSLLPAAAEDDVSRSDR